MPLPVAIALLVKSLAANGLSLLGNAILAKGKEVVEEKIGVKIPDNSGELTERKLNELAKAQIEHQEFLIKAGLEETKVYMDDRKDARARDVEIVKSGKNNLRGDILAYGAVGSLILTLILLFLLEVPRGSRDLLLVVLGSLMVIVKDVYGFEFGSSKDSARSNQAISDMLKNGNEPKN